MFSRDLTNQLNRFKKSARANSRNSANRYSKSRNVWSSRFLGWFWTSLGGGGVLDTWGQPTVDPPLKCLQRFFDSTYFDKLFSSRTDKTCTINLLVSFNAVSSILVFIQERLKLSVSFTFVSRVLLPQPTVLVLVVFVLREEKYTKHSIVYG